jgi:NADH-quinone oxidoreductase subunit M
MLSTLLLLPLTGALIIAPLSNRFLIQTIGLSTSLLTFIASLWLWIFFDNSASDYQFMESIKWLPTANLNVILGVDGISLFFILLTTFLVPICLLVGWTSIKMYIKEYFIFFLVLETLMIGVFAILDVFLFYIFFESILIPMFLMIGV